MVPLKRCTATHVPRPKVLQRQCYRELMQAEHFGILQAPIQGLVTITCCRYTPTSSNIRYECSAS